MQAFLLSGPELPRYDIDDPSVLANIRNKMPMIITGSLLIEPVRRRWTLDYLAKHSKDVSYSVKMSSGHFRAADHESNDAGSVLWVLCVVVACRFVDSPL